MLQVKCSLVNQPLFSYIFFPVRIYKKKRGWFTRLSKVICPRETKYNSECIYFIIIIIIINVLQHRQGYNKIRREKQKQCMQV